MMMFPDSYRCGWFVRLLQCTDGWTKLWISWWKRRLFWWLWNRGLRNNSWVSDCTLTTKMFNELNESLCGVKLCTSLMTQVHIWEMRDVSHNSKESDCTLIGRIWRGSWPSLCWMTWLHGMRFYLALGKILWENLGHWIAYMSASEIKAMHFVYVTWLKREPLNTDSCGVPGSGEVEYPQRGYGQP